MTTRGHKRATTSSPPTAEHGGPAAHPAGHVENGSVLRVVGLKPTPCAREVAVRPVVLSTRERTRIGRLLLGSVTERVVRLAPCPVLTVRPGMRGSLQSAATASAATVSATDETVSADPAEDAA